MLRLLFDGPASGPWNMAVDDVLLETAAATGQATLRFYQWKEPTLSLGYFQELSDRVRHPASSACPIVRRATGGGAILHDRELTYSLALPEVRGSRSRAAELYDRCHSTLIAALHNLGITATLYGDAGPCSNKPNDYDETPQCFLCFQRRTCFDVILSEAKIAGSAQRRRRGAILQHGSVLFARSEFAPELPGIEELTGVQTPWPSLIKNWAPRLADWLRLPLIPGNLTDSELRHAEGLAEGRFSSPDRLYRR